MEQEYYSYPLYDHNALLLYGVEIIWSTLVLIVSWSTPCDTPLRWWLLLFTLRIFVVLKYEIPLHIMVVIYQTIGILPWYFVGQYWLTSSQTTCRHTNPILWYWCIALSNLYILYLIWVRYNVAINVLTCRFPTSIVDEPGKCCSLCRLDVALGEHLVTTQCHDEFHGECLVQWNQTKNYNKPLMCPVCRIQLDQE